MYRLKNMSKVKMPRFSPKALSSGYKTTVNKSMSNSSFWLDDDMLSRGSSKDIVKLAGYKRAIGNFVKILTKDDSIKVQFSSGQQSYTDGKLVVVSAKIDDKEFDSTVGLALHESAHCILTNFADCKSFLENARHGTNGTDGISWSQADILKDIINVIEDRRIDQYVFTNAPGYRGYYEAVYDRYFNSKTITEVLQARLKNKRTVEDYMFHIINIANPNRTPDILPGLRDIFKLIDLRNISRLKSTAEVCVLAREVYDLMMANIPTEAPQEQGGQPQPEKDGQPETGTDGQAPGTDTDDEQNDPNMDMQGGGSGSDTEDSDTDSNGKGKGEGKEDDEDEAETNPSMSKEKQDKLLEKLEKDMQKQKDFMDGKIKKQKVSKGDAAKINAAAESNMQYADAVFGGRKIKVMNVKGLTEKILITELIPEHSVSPKSLYNDYYTKVNDACINEGIKLGTMLGKRLKTRDENRSLLTTRLAQGSLDRRLIAELGFGNEKVFNKTLHHTVTPSLLYLSIDVSGSMSGAKWQSALTTSIAIAKAASMVASVEVVIALRGTFRAGNDYMPLNWEVYDSRKDRFANFKSLIRYVHAGGSTPESLCYSVVKNEIVKAASVYETYFINISDGAPGFSGGYVDYGGQPAQDHAKKIMTEFRAAGIKILSYFVDSCYDPAARLQSSLGRAFTYMYGKEAAFIDTANLGHLSKTLNELLERKG